MKKVFLGVLALSTLNAFAQTKASKPKASPTMFANTITAADLKSHLYVIAGKDMEGRETASEGQKKAAAYIENQFKKLGLLPGNNGSYQMPYPVYQDSLVNATLRVNGVKYDLDKDFNVNINNYPAMMGFSEVVYIAANVPADSVKAANLAGKLVLLAPEAQAGGGRFQMSPKMQALRAANPAAVFSIMNNYPRKTTASRLGNQTLTFYKKALTPQAVTVSDAVAKAILGKYDMTDANRVTTVPAEVLFDFTKATKELTSSNVIGVLPGTDKKDEYLFITAHYDHLGKRDTVVYYGADDDGSGTVGVLEIAEAFAKAKASGNGPRRTVVFMTVSGEEKGLWGSDYYGSHPIFPLEKTTADLNIDMIGRSDATRKPDTLNYVYVVGDDKLSSDLKTISESVNNKYTKLQLDYKFNDPKDPNRIYYRSDHYNFAKHGVPIIFYYDGMLGADYHRPTDTPDKINYDLQAKRAQLVFYTGWEMANRDEMLKRDIPLDTSIFNR